MRMAADLVRLLPTCGKVAYILNFSRINAWIKPNIKKQAHSQGIGRHSQEEVVNIGLKDLEAMSDLLGNTT